MTYTFHADEQVWHTTVYNGEMEVENEEVTDFIEYSKGYYWIESEERDEVLAVGNFVEGEECVVALHNGDIETFEEAEEEFETAVIQEDRPY